MLPKPQYSPLPSLVALSAGSFADRVGVVLKIRWFVHLLARVAIAATCTSSAAALDAQVGAENTVLPLIACGSISC